jgi:hypothetical protein
MIRIIIAGGRDFNSYELMKDSIDSTLTKLSIKNLSTGLGKHPARFLHRVEFISGTARGADSIGEAVVSERGWKVHRFPADWDAYGKRAGYLRNEQMAKFAISDESYGVLIAFWDGKSRGTKHMIDLAEKHGLEVFIINY